MRKREPQQQSSQQQQLVQQHLGYSNEIPRRDTRLMPLNTTHVSFFSHKQSASGSGILISSSSPSNPSSQLSITASNRARAGSKQSHGSSQTGLKTMHGTNPFSQHEKSSNLTNTIISPLPSEDFLFLPAKSTDQRNRSLAFLSRTPSKGSIDDPGAVSMISRKQSSGEVLSKPNNNSNLDISKHNNEVKNIIKTKKNQLNITQQQWQPMGNAYWIDTGMNFSNSSNSGLQGKYHKTNSLSRTLAYLSPLNSETLTPGDSQIITTHYDLLKGNSNEEENSKLPNKYTGTQKWKAGLQRMVDTQQSTFLSAKNSSIHLPADKSAILNKEEYSLQHESSLLTANKADLMSQLRRKCTDNFYGKLIQQALEVDQQTNPDKLEKSPFRQRLTSIKQSLSVSMVKLINNDLFSENSSKNNSITPYSSQQSPSKDQIGKTPFFQNNSKVEKVEEEQQQSQQKQVINDPMNLKSIEELRALSRGIDTSWKFKKLEDKKEDKYNHKFNAITKNLITSRENSLQLRGKLFSVIQNKDLVVVHSSQNKDLMVPSERTEAVGLARWYEEKINQVKKQHQQSEAGSSSYSKTFDDLQLIHHACMSEIVRQVSMHCVERGQLLKWVWESLMNLIGEGFSQLEDEKTQFEKEVITEIEKIEQTCSEQVQKYIPLVESMRAEIAKKDAISQRIVMEFEYLKKKNHKLEKLLKSSKDEQFSISQDYTELAKQLEEIRNANDSNNARHIRDKQKMSTVFLQQLGDVANRQLLKHSQYSKQALQEQDSLQIMQDNYEQDERAAAQSTGVNQQDVDEIEYHMEVQDNNNKRLFQDNQVSKTESIDIEGYDGTRLILTSIGTQVTKEREQAKKLYQLIFLIKNVVCQTNKVEDDLIGKTQVETDTEDLIQKQEQEVQTDEPIKNNNSKYMSVDLQNITNIEGDSQQQRNDNNFNGENNNNNIQDGSQSAPNEQWTIADPSMLSFHSLQNKSEEVEENEDYNNNTDTINSTLAPPTFKKHGTSSFLRLHRKEKERTLPPRRNSLGSEMEVTKEHSSPKTSRERRISETIIEQYITASQQGSHQRFFKEIIMDESQNTPSIESDIDPDGSGNSSPEISLLEGGKRRFKETKHAHKQLKQTLESTLRASVEGDISDLHMILSSKNHFVQDVFMKIINHQLLKDSEQVNYQQLEKFVEDGQAFKNEETQLFKNIWRKCKNQLISFVKQKITLAEKQAEVEEANQNITLGQGLFKKLVSEYEELIEQLGSSRKNVYSNNGSPKDEIRIPKGEIESDFLENSSRKLVSLNSIDNEVEEEEEDDSNLNETSFLKIRSEINTPEKKPSKNKNVTSKKNINNSNNASMKSSSSQLLPNKSSKPALPKSKLSILSEEKKYKGSETTIKQNNNNNSRFSVFDEEIMQTSSLNSTPRDISQLSNKNRLSRIINQSTYKRNGSIRQSMTQQQIASSSQPIEEELDDMDQQSSINNIEQQIFQQKSSMGDIFKSYRFKKHKLKKKCGLQSSPNAEAALNFLNATALRITNENNKKKDKGPLFTELNTKKYIALIYNDKIKQIKSGDNSNPLHNVAYDFFLNKFGFKKLAEKNLTQFVRSLKYHYKKLDRAKVFLQFYGADPNISYDQDDFNFYIESFIQLDENLPALFQQLVVFSLPKVLDLLQRNFESTLNSRVYMKIKSEIEALKFNSNEVALKNKALIEQDISLQCLLSAKLEQKKISIIALKPVYLAGDIDNDQAIGLDEFIVLARHIEKGLSQLSILQLFWYGTDLIDEITGERTMSFQQFAQLAVENGLFNEQIQKTYLLDIEEWDQIKNIEQLGNHWQQRKDIIRLRFVKYNCYKNFYRLMVQRIDGYFSQHKPSESAFKQLDQGQYGKQHNLNRTSGIALSRPSMGHLDDQHLNSNTSSPRQQFQSFPKSPSASNQQQHNILMNFSSSLGVYSAGTSGNINISSNTIMKQNINAIDQEEYEQKQMTWLIYRLLDDESKRVVVEPQVEMLLPKEFLCFSGILGSIVQDNKQFATMNKENPL